MGEVAGVPQIFSKFQRRKGHKSDVLTFSKPRREVNFFYSQKSFYPLSLGEATLQLSRLCKEYDILHFHSPRSSLWYGRKGYLAQAFGYSIFRALGKKIFLHHHGTDIRGKKERYANQYLVDKIFVSTPDLLEYSPKALWLPNPIDLEEFQYLGIRRDINKVTIVHAPSNRKKKGTAFVLKAIEKIKKEGYNINFLLVENMPYSKVIKYYKQADIVVDQLLTGWYGMVSIEGMALGKPICVYIKENLKSYMPFMPFLNTSTRNIEDNLRLLIEDCELRMKLSKKSRKYVEHVHDGNKITDKLMSIYNTC
mgnify:CR=1 FL=1